MGEPGNDANGKYETRYDAFISYSHEDVRVAAAVQRGLARIGRRFGELSALRVFRDHTDLTPGDDLPGRLTRALDSSQYLVVIMSPAAAESDWVNKEISHWLSLGRRHRLLLVSVSGPLTYDDQARCLGHASSAVPPALGRRGVLPEEPLYVDLSQAVPWDLANPAFRDALTGLAATIHGKAKSALAGEDLKELRRYQRWRRAAFVGIAVLAAISMIAAGLAVRQRGLAIQQRDEAVSMLLASQSNGIRESDPSLALALAAESRPEAPEDAIRTTAALIDANVAFRHRSPAIGEPLVGTGSMNAVAFSPDSTLLASASNSAIEIWDPNRGVLLGRMPEEATAGGPQSLAFSPDGRILASGQFDDTVRLLDLATASQVGAPLVGHTSVVVSVAFSPDGRTLASGSWDGTVRLWDPATGRPIGKPLRHPSEVNAVAFSPDGATIATACNDTMVRLWDAKTGSLVGEPLIGHTDEVTDVAFSPDGLLLASVALGQDRSLRFWDAETGEPFARPMTQTFSHSIAFSPDSHILAGGSGDFTLTLVDTKTVQQLGPPLTGHTGMVQDVAFSPDGTALASCDPYGIIRLWDTTGVRPLGEVVTEYDASATAVKFSPDGTLLAAAGDGEVSLLDSETGDLVRGPLRGAGGTDLAFSPDGRLLASASGDGSVRLWNTGTGAPVGSPLTGHTYSVNAVAFSPDGRLLASASADTLVRLWDPATGSAVGVPLRGHTDEIEALAFRPDGQVLASGGHDGTVRFWDPLTGVPVGNPLSQQAPVTTIAYSPDGRLLAVNSDFDVRIWDVSTGLPTGGSLTGHRSEVTALAFSPDGALLASASRDGTVRFWSAGTTQAVGEPLQVHSAAIDSLALSPTAERFATAEDRTIVLWDSLWDWHEACDLASKRVYRAQLATFLPDGWTTRCNYREAPPSVEIPAISNALAATIQTAPEVSDIPAGSGGVASSRWHKGFPSGTHNWYIYPEDPDLSYLNAVTRVSGSKLLIAIDQEDQTACYEGAYDPARGTFRVSGKSRAADDFIDTVTWSGAVHGGGGWLYPDGYAWKDWTGDDAMEDAKSLLADCRQITADELHE